VLLEMKVSKQKAGPLGGSYLGGGGPGCPRWPHAHKSADSSGVRYLRPAKDCMNMSKLQVSKPLQSSELVQGAEKDLINSLLKACSSSN